MISYTKTPLKYAPSNNPVVFSISGDNSNLILFKLSLVEESTLGVVYTGNIFPTPLNPNVASINLNNQLSSLVRPQVDNTDVLVVGKTRPIVGYRLDTTEYAASAGTIYALTTAATSSDFFYAFDAALDIFNYTKRFTGDTYVMKSGSTDHKFLTLQPQNKIVNDYSFEQLYFLQENLDGVKVRYDVGGNTFRETFSGDQSTAYVLVPEVPENRAIGYITITGTCQAYDNIGISANTQVLGAYTASSSSFTTTQLATNIGAAISGNSYGYTVSTSANTIAILAPVGLGASGNTIDLHTALTKKTVVSYTVTGATTGDESSVLISGYTAPLLGDFTTVNVIDAPIYNSNLNICTYMALSADTIDISAFTNNLVAELNTNPYGFQAVSWGTYFIITAPSGSTTVFDGTLVQADFQTLAITITEYFAGGIMGSGVQYYYNTVIPNTVTEFTGGTDMIPAVTGLTNERMIRLATSPKKLERNGITGFTHNGIYTIQLEDLNQTPISETRKYVYNDVECNLEYMNVCFTNSMGGIDSYQFVNPQVSVGVTNLSIKKSNMNLDAPERSEYITSGVYNTNDEIYKSTTKSTIKVWTKSLTDAEANWLTELINSKNIWIELSDEVLVPIQLSKTNYPIQKNKYMKEINMFNFEFTLSDNYLSALAVNGIVVNE